MKRCSKCGVEKEEVEFHKSKERRDGLQPYCKACRKAIGITSYGENIEQERARKKKYREENKDKEKAYREANKERLTAKSKAYYAKNRDTVRRRSVRYTLTRMAQDPLFRANMAVRTLIRNCLKYAGVRKDTKTSKLLGISVKELVSYLGPKPSESAHIDHICPCAQARNEEELLKLQHYTNLRWLPAEENLKKSDNKTPEAEELCRKLLGREWED